MKLVLVFAPVAAAISISMAPAAYADPGISSPNDDAFITAITGDGISLDNSDAIIDAHAVCAFLAWGDPMRRW